MIEKIILKKSAVLDKMPAADQLEFGELALNYNAEHPFLSFKDSDGDIMPLNDYSQDIAYLYSHKLDAGVLDTINENTDAIKKKLNISDFNAFKEDNTKTINALDRNVSQNAMEIQEVNGIVQNHTDAIATLNTSIEQKADKTELDTINANVDQKVSKTDITQSTGTSTTSVMSQKAVSDALSNSGFALLYELGFSDLRHFYASRVDADTATYYVDEGIPEWVRTCPMLNNRYALNIDRFFNDNNISIGSKKYTKHIKSAFVWIEIIDNNSFVAYQNYSGTLKSVIGDASTVGEFAFCEIAKGFKLDITGFSTVVFEIDKSVKNVLSSMYGLNGQTYSDLSVYRERGNKYYSPYYNVNYIRGYVSILSVASSSYSNIINIKRDNGNLEIEQAKINSSTLEIASTVNTVYENSVPLINPMVSDIQDEEKLYLSPLVYNYSAPLPYIPHTTIKVYGKK